MLYEAADVGLVHEQRQLVSGKYVLMQQRQSSDRRCLLEQQRRKMRVVQHGIPPQRQHMSGKYVLV